MFTKVLNSILIVLSLCSCRLNAKTITAQSYDAAIQKIYKKNLSSSTFDYIGIQRKFMLLHNSYYWGYDNLYNDTIYVCDVVHMYSSTYNEYIITSKRIYSLENIIGKSLMCKVLSSQEEVSISDIRLLDYVRNWDVGVFKRWNTTTANDYTYVNAIRIIRLSKRKYMYDYYSFYDNGFEEDGYLI